MNTLKNEPDEILIRRVALFKDESAFKEIFDRYVERVFGLIYRYTGSYPETEELTQDVFLKIFNKANTFKGHSKLSTWIYRITVNVCKNYKRKKKPEIFSIEEITNSQTEGFKLKDEIMMPDFTTPKEILDRKRKIAIIQQAIERLPPNQRVAFILSKYHGFSYAEIASVMNISISAVESLLFRAKQNLKKLLIPYREKGEI